MNVSVTYPFSLGSEILIKITNRHSAGRKNGSALPLVSIRLLSHGMGQTIVLTASSTMGAVAELQLVYLLVNINLHLHVTV